MLAYQKLFLALEKIGIKPESFSERFLTQKPPFAEDTCITWQAEIALSSVMFELLDMYYMSIGLGGDNVEDYSFFLNKTSDSLGIEYPDVIDSEANISIRIASKANMFGGDSLLSIYIECKQDGTRERRFHYVVNTSEEPDEWTQRLRESYAAIHKKDLFTKGAI